MTAITIATDIPSSIVTLEQLHAWSGLTLSRINPSLAILEAENFAQYVMQSGIFSAADNSNRLLTRASLALDMNYISDRSKKLWMFANEFSAVAIPAAFKGN
ncbi:glucose-6-phosphate dehydrogenase [Phormidesmis priestleyi ULC007]|uniref:Glucose-6-phosphate dehydrogenase n=1 Tax=Phormidesmis priestleyi ULC007 TaxID=1920490 RepID=A0A2T1D6D1_9CYAN|nr:hypothetical protein [Phormidesmis priestleyi]PSB16048.1 glucose-6-phosphate dehydrogenase [Phormidesmis priestleyi ULC007]PZO52244.1 MAG: glucose-6-phosphate dehydrogenase [Phormidesmis priestleyi]